MQRRLGGISNSLDNINSFTLADFLALKQIRQGKYCMFFCLIAVLAFMVLSNKRVYIIIILKVQRKHKGLFTFE